VQKDVLKVAGINSKGFGSIPKLVMQDRRLTPEAKCIYAYFSSYAGAGTNAFPGRSKILYDLCMSKDRYYRHFKLLIDYGYITVEQAKKEGKWSRNIYILNTDISDKPTPCPQNDDTEPCPQNRDTQNEDTQNKNTNSINKRKYKKKDKPMNEDDRKSKYEKFYL